LDRLLALRNPRGHCFNGGLEAKGTRLSGNVTGIVLILRRQGREAAEALGGFRFTQGGINPHALVENKAFAIVVRAATFLKIFENAPIELMDVPEALAFHVGARLLTTNAAGTKHDDGLIFEGLWKLGDRLGKITKMVNACGDGSAEGAEFDLIVVARVEQREPPPLIDPALERSSREFWGGSAGGIDTIHTKGDDFLFYPHEHSGEWLLSAQANLRAEIFQTGQNAEGLDQGFNSFLRAGHKKVNALGAQKDRAFESFFPAKIEEAFALSFEIAQLGKSIGSNVCDLF
jgi:hypothetical protein